MNTAKTTTMGGPAVRRLALFAFAILWLGFGYAPASEATDGYQMPVAAIADLIDAPPPPAVMVSPDNE